MVPEGHLGAFISKLKRGTWTLTVADDRANDTGTLNSWSLNLTAILTPAISPTTTSTYSIPSAIPDDNWAGVTSTLTVGGLGSHLYDLDLTTFIRHTFRVILTCALTSPAGTVVTITTNNGGTNDNVFNGTVWNDSATETVTDHIYSNGTPVLSLSPEAALAAFVGGKSEWDLDPQGF